MKIPRILCGVLVCVLVGMANATTYYVDATAGDDSRDGQTQATSWKTIAKVNGASFVAGAQSLFKRGEVWRASLVPPSSGAAENPIEFDAYGSGDAPSITGYIDLAAANWTLDSGNIWKTNITSTSFSYILFGGSIWGLKHTTGKSSCVAPYDFYFAGNVLYVFATSNPQAYYGSVAAMLMANGSGQLIYVNNKSWLEFQHFKLSYFDTYGVRVTGTSDHITMANMSADGVIPAGALPHGFYVNVNPNPTDINFYNVDAHRNYNGFRFDGGGTGIRVKNCRAYANRNKGMEDNTNGTNFSYCHFYGNGLGVLLSTDWTGGVSGGGNITGGVGPALSGFQRYPARITMTIDDPGLAAGEDTYVDSMLPVFDVRGLKASIGVVAGYASGIQSKVQGWLNAGHDVNAHSWSHQYYTNLNGFSLQYTGTGTAAALTISGNVLSTSVTGGPGGENLNLSLANASYDSISKLVGTINSRGGYSATQDANCQGAVHSIALADVAGQAIKASAYTALLQKDRLVPDEMASAKNWLQINLTGLGNVKVYIYPSGIEDTSTQAWAVAAGYEGSRGGLAMNAGFKEVHGMGVNIQDVTSLGISGLHNFSQTQIADQVRALVFKASVWGVPFGFFYHNQELTAAEAGYVLDALTTSGAQVITNTQLMDWLASQATVAGTTNHVSAAQAEVDWKPTAASPVVNVGTDLGAGYKLDVMGVDQSWMGSGWDIGAYAFPPAGMFVIVE